MGRAAAMRSAHANAGAAARQRADRQAWRAAHRAPPARGRSRDRAAAGGGAVSSASRASSRHEPELQLCTRVCSASDRRRLGALLGALAQCPELPPQLALLGDDALHGPLQRACRQAAWRGRRTGHREFAPVAAEGDHREVAPGGRPVRSAAAARRRGSHRRCRPSPDRDGRHRPRPPPGFHRRCRSATGTRRSGWP